MVTQIESYCYQNVQPTPDEVKPVAQEVERVQMRGLSRSQSPSFRFLGVQRGWGCKGKTKTFKRRQKFFH